jgi:hypothetical protein
MALFTEDGRLVIGGFSVRDQLLLADRAPAARLGPERLARLV